MEKRIRKSIQKEFRKIVKNITGERLQESHEISKPPEIEVVERRSVEVHSGIDQCCSQNQVTFENDVENTLAALKSEISYDPLQELSMNFNSILVNEYFSDVNIKCGTDVLKAHKIVLCARSPVFEAMFTNPMQESEDGIVIIEDIEPRILRDLLDFVYSGQLKDLTVSKACDLLYTAEKYQIRTLKQLCVDHLRSNLSVENAFQILECANLYDVQLRSHTLKYISDQFSVIETTEDWKNVQHRSPTLALEVYSTVVQALQGKN